MRRLLGGCFGWATGPTSRDRRPFATIARLPWPVEERVKDNAGKVIEFTLNQTTNAVSNVHLVP